MAVNIRTSILPKTKRKHRVANLETLAAIKEGRKLARDPKSKKFSDMDQFWDSLMADIEK